MLNVMRENLKHLKWVLWIVAASMVLFLGQYFSCRRGSRGMSEDSAAEVNGVTISTQDFLAKARQMVESYRQIFGDGYEQIRPQLQIGPQVIQAMVNREIVRQEAERLGIRASEAEIRERILENPSLRDEGGAFIGKQAYAYVINSSVQGGVAAYEASLANDIVIKKWMDLMGSSVTVTDDDVFEAFRADNDKTEIDYVVVASAAQDVDENVTDDQARQWYQSHQDDYRVAEGRRLRYLIVDRQSQLPKIEIADEEVAAYYEQNKESFTHPEQRRASHILLKVDPGAPPEEKERVRAKAEQILSRLKAGEDFAQVAERESDDPESKQRGGDLGFFQRGQMVPEFDRAVFSTPVGEFAPVTETGFGLHVIRVTDARPGGTAPLEEVRDNLVKQLRQRRADEMVDEEIRRLAAQIDSVETLETVASKEGLEVGETIVRRNKYPSDLGPSPDFMDAVFGLEPGAASEPLRVRAGRALVVVTETVPPEIAPLDEVRGKVTADFLNDLARRAALSSARRALASKGNLRAAAKSLGLEVEHGADLTPSQTLPRTGGSSPEYLDALFGPDTVAGQTGVVPVPAGAMIYQVTVRTPYDPAQFEASKETYRQRLLEERRSSLVDSILAKLRLSYDVSINQELINRVHG